MWLRRAVGIVLIVTLIGMNVIAVLGLFVPDKKTTAGLNTATQELNGLPVVSITADPETVGVGNAASINWSTTGSPTKCTASGAWDGIKTPFGSETSGRLSTTGTLTYKLSCSNEAGAAESSISVVVSSDPSLVSRQTGSGQTGSAGSGGGSAKTPTTPGKTYCQGRIPCYSTKEITSHGSKGSCWGWLGDRVINVTGFDVGFHVARSGVASVELSGICGKDLMPAVAGRVPSSDYPSGHEHTLGATSNTDKNYLSYFVGYYDSTKP